MNQHKTAVKGPCFWLNPKTGKNEEYNGTVSHNFSPDIHFFMCDSNYGKLVTTVTAAAFTTQFLGNLVDIAVHEDKQKSSGTFPNANHWMSHIKGAFVADPEEYERTAAGGNSLASARRAAH